MKQAIIIIGALIAYSLSYGQSYTIHSCSENCGVVTFAHQHTTLQMRSSSAVWDQPIRIVAILQEGVIKTVAEIEEDIKEDSDIAINEGLYTGSGDAYILAGVIDNIDLSVITDAGYPLRTDMINVAFGTLDDPTLGDLLDQPIIDGRDCYGAQYAYVIVKDNILGPQEVATGGLPPSAHNFPVGVLKESASNAFNLRNHAYTHAAGDNAPNHQDGPDPTKRPMQTTDGKSFGWSTTGTLGFSGGNFFGIGPNGEDIAGHMRASYNNWLSIIPNLSISSLSGPSSTELGETESFLVEINKELIDTVYSWTFTSPGKKVTSTMNPATIMFDEAGEWTYTVTVSNSCGGQEVEGSGTIMVNAGQQAPIARCASGLVLALDANGETVLTADMLDNGSSDPDGTIVSKEVNGANQVTFNCQETGNQSVSLTVTDNDGLSSSCSTMVEIVDDIAPSVECIDQLTIELVAGQDTTLSVTEIEVITDDNCDFTVNLDNNSFNGNSPGTYTVITTATDDAGNQSTCTTIVQVDMVSATIDVTETDAITIFPNPTTDGIRIQIDGIDIQTITAFDIVGRRLTMITAPMGSIDLNVSDWMSGAYFLILHDKDGNVYRAKILKE